jgi:hypothetical protein
MSRDPRLDPAPGDVLERSFLTYTVERAPPNGHVFAKVDHLGCVMKARIPQWRRLMKSARVLSTAAPEGSGSGA